MEKRRTFLRELKKDKILLLMALPAVVVVFLISYIPMSGIILAFKNYQYNLGIFKSPWDGLNNFRFFFLSGTGLLVTRNTILYNLLNIFTSQALAILIAVVFSEMTSKYFKKTSQTIIFLPYFISWIIVGAFVYNLFDYQKGGLNALLKFFGFHAVNLYQIPWAWVIIICLFNAWKWVGYNAVIYIAAIAGIDMECFEAATLDGASIYQKIRYITLPGIMNTIVIILLLNISRIMRGDFQMFYQIVGNNGQLFNTTDVIDTFVFRSLINSGDIGMSAAAAFYQSFFCFAIIIGVNALIKKWNRDYALF